jgi:acyl-CoA synthetase (NDP forming)
VVISAGFVETDEHGAALQREMSALVVDRGLVLVGPNCFGVASVVNRCGGFTGSGLHESRVGNISVLSTLLEGTRGGHGVDRAALTTMLCTLAALMVQQPRIASVDLNPVFGYPDGVLAVDARVERQPLVDRVDN